MKKLETKIEVISLLDFLKYCSPDMPDQPHDCEYLYTVRCPRYVTCNIVRKAEAYIGFAKAGLTL